MDLRLETRREGDAAVVAVGGEIDNYTAGRFREALSAAFADGAQRAVADLSGTDFLDSSALGALVAVYKRIEGSDKRLLIVCPKPPLRKLFEISHLDTLFDMFDDVGSALAAA